jgi:histidyl-tRNA synthetase
MRDFLPGEKAKRDGVMAAIRASFAAFGYREIETPVAEELGRLQSGQGGDNEKLIFKILKRGLDPATPIDPDSAADLGLRFDLTVPLSRFYATHRGVLPDVFRSIQIAPVWRA